MECVFGSEPGTSTVSCFIFGQLQSGSQLPQGPEGPAPVPDLSLHFCVRTSGGSSIGGARVVPLVSFHSAGRFQRRWLFVIVSPLLFEGPAES